MNQNNKFKNIINILSQLYILIINSQILLYLPLIIITIGSLNQHINNLLLAEMLSNPLHYVNPYIDVSHMLNIQQSGIEDTVNALNYIREEIITLTNELSVSDPISPEGIRLQVDITHKNNL